MSSEENILPSICESFGWKLISAQPLLGGDINSVFRLNTSAGEFVIKINDRSKYPGMFEAEKLGLETLAKSESFRVPDVVSVGEESTYSYLILEYLERGSRKDNFWSHYAQDLVKLHQYNADRFGFSGSNYIGSLPQQNEWCDGPAEFYISQRLIPQLKMARDNGYSLPEEDSFFKNVENMIPIEENALIHGDLWNGNHMVDESGSSVLIDPSVSFSIREMDLAMMQLFGGFPSTVYQEYNEIFPLEAGHEERVSLYQLYYLLVHLNLFGSGYLLQVRLILNRFS